MEKSKYLFLSLKIMTKHSKEATKEHNEHKWTTWEQAERIALDHKNKRKHT